MLQKYLLTFLTVVLSLSTGLPGQHASKPLRFTGKVVLANGESLPEPAQIFLTCGEGRGRLLGTTSVDGNFSVGQGPATAMPDATTSSGTSDLGRSAGTRVTVNLSGCELYASLGAYVSSRIGLGVRSLFESPDVGTIVLYPADENPDPFQSVTTLKAPQKALKSYEKAQRELAKKKPKPSSALKELRKAVEVYPSFAAAWNLMGEAYLRDEDVDGASEAFQTAIQADPGFAPPYLALAFLRLRERDFEEALHMADRVLELSPDSAEADFYKANAFAGLGDLEEAEASLRAVLVSPEVDRFPRTHYLLGTILARTGRTEEAVREYRKYLRLEPDSRLAQAVKQQLEEWASEGLIQ